MIVRFLMRTLFFAVLLTCAEILLNARGWPCTAIAIVAVMTAELVKWAVR